MLKTMKFQMMLCVSVVAAVTLLGSSSTWATGQWINNSEVYGTNSPPLNGNVTGTSSIGVTYDGSSLIVSPSAQVMINNLIQSPYNGGITLWGEETAWGSGGWTWSGGPMQYTYGLKFTTSIAGAIYTEATYVLGGLNSGEIGMVAGDATTLLNCSSAAASMDENSFITGSFTNASFTNNGPSITYSPTVTITNGNLGSGACCSFGIDYTNEYLVAPGATSIDAEASITCSADLTLDLFNCQCDDSLAGGDSKAGASGTITFVVNQIPVE